MFHLIFVLIIGALAGWIAGAIMKTNNSSLLVDIVLGIVGGWLGYMLFGHLLSITFSPFINEVITATAGAAILLLVIKLIRRA